MKGKVLLLGLVALCGPIAAQMVQRQTPDGSVRVTVPANWSLTGAAGKVVSDAPDASAGFLFTTFEVLPPGRLAQLAGPAAIVSPYQSPAQAVAFFWQRFGNRNIRIISSQPDGQSSLQCTASIARPCEAADVMLEWVAPSGAACVGSFKVLNARPDNIGQWFSIVGGIWGSQTNFAAQLPVLQTIASSFSINNRDAQDYIRQGLLRLEQMRTNMP